MKKTGQDAQALIAIIIVMAIVFSVGAAVLFHSRAFLETTNLQLDSDQAYTMSRSGLEIIGENGKCVTSLNETYDAGGGKSIHVEASRAYSSDFSTILGNVTSVGITGKSMRVFEGTDSYPINGWAKTYGVTGSGNNDKLYSLKQATDGGYILGGDSDSYAGRSTEALVVKTNYFGDIVWANIYGGSTSTDRLRGLIQAQDGGYAFCGWSNVIGPAFGGNYFLLVKTSPDGTLSWVKTYGLTGYQWETEYCYAFQQTIPDFGYILGGSYSTTLAPESKAALAIKTDSAGNMSWAYWYGIINSHYYSNEITAVQQTSDSGYIFGGYTNCKGTIDFLVIKTDATGYAGSGSAYRWHYIYGQTGNDQLSCLQQTQDGGYILGGTSNSLRSDNDFYVIKIFSTGAVDWAYQYGITGTNSDEVLYSLVQAQDGSYLLGGTTSGRFLYIKINSAGVVQSASTYRKSSYTINTLRSLSSTNDGGYVLGGDSTPVSPANDFFIIKNNGSTDALDLDCCSINTDVTATIVRIDMTASTFQDNPNAYDNNCDGGNYTSSYGVYVPVLNTFQKTSKTAGFPTTRVCPE